MCFRYSARLLLLGALVSASCAPDEGGAIAEGIFAPPGEILPSANASERELFERGQAVALRRFSQAEGAGPAFNATFCGSCHEKPRLGGSAAHYRDFLLVAARRNGSMELVGQGGVQRHFSAAPPYRVPTEPEATWMALRNPVPFFGVGLLAEIPEEEIRRRADPQDRDGDGISGRVNFEGTSVGRFGRKAQTSDLEGFVRGPMFNHVGITSAPLPRALRAELPVPTAAPLFTAEGAAVSHQVAAPGQLLTDSDLAPDPELSEQELFSLVAFTMLLAAPQPSAADVRAEHGKGLFESIGCQSCHVPALHGPRGAIPAYSDLLLHEMGDELADGIEMGVAAGAEFRTQPLWGVAATGPYLHDGRAPTLDAAIRAHGGEAQRAQQAYAALADSERQAVVAFVESLGGAKLQSAGMLAPAAPVPAAGEYGAPLPGLSAPQAEQFLRGRALFDADHAQRDGLGPRFNGDSCRACHFDPVAGGAGPRDVNVTRQGIWENGAFVVPQPTTMAHRHSVHSERPPVDDRANFFEQRQTQPLFGMGLIDAVDEATLRGLEDPSDLDGDGIRGRAHRLEDGRIGRFGWKADIATLRDFVRDALSTEMGLTVAANSGSTMGLLADRDETADPEVSAPEIEDLLFFVAELAPPPRGTISAATEQQGAKLFDQVGCAGCHVPELSSGRGPVELYSDLLLHTMGTSISIGIEVGQAGPSDYRTPPLWGLSQTAPYLHDGSAASIEQALRAHEGEAAASAAKFDALPANEQAILLEFLRSL